MHCSRILMCSRSFLRRRAELPTNAVTPSSGPAIWRSSLACGYAGALLLALVAFPALLLAQGAGWRPAYGPQGRDRVGNPGGPGGGIFQQLREMPPAEQQRFMD